MREEEPSGCPYANREQYPRCYNGHLAILCQDEFGPYERFKPCPICTEKDQQKREVKICAAAIENLRHSVAPIFHPAVDLNFNPHTTARYCENYLDKAVRRVGNRLHADKGFFLCGTPGTGKTFASIYALSRMIRLCPLTRPFHAQNWSDLIDRYLTFADTRPLRRQIEQADAIVVDDIGRVKRTDQAAKTAQQDLLFLLIDRAMGYEIPAILISNLSVADFLNLLGSGAAKSRAESLWWVWSEVTGADLRQKVRESS